MPKLTTRKCRIAICGTRRRRSSKLLTDVNALPVVHSSELCDAAAQRPTTSVIVHANPLQPFKALFTKLPNMESALKSILSHVGEMFRESKLGPHSITMHEDRCAFGAVLWPRAFTPLDVEEMQDAVAERERECRCKPLVMYVGAMA